MVRFLVGSVVIVLGFVNTALAQPATEFYLQRNDVYVQASSASTAEGDGVVIVYEMDRSGPVPVETIVPFYSSNVVDGGVGLTSGAVSSQTDGVGSASAQSAGTVSISVPPVEQATDGPAMIATSTSTADSDHLLEWARGGTSNAMSFFLDLEIASSIHPAGTDVECSLECSVSWMRAIDMYFFLDAYWEILGPVMATVYVDQDFVCVDYPSPTSPGIITVCSTTSLLDPIGSLSVNLDGEGSVGESVLMRGYNVASPANFGGGGFVQADGVGSFKSGYTLITGDCKMTLGNLIP